MPQNEKNAKPIGRTWRPRRSWSKTECQKSGKAFYAPAFLYYEKLCRTLRHCCDLYFYHGSRKCAGNLVYADLNRRLYPAADEASDPDFSGLAHAILRVAVFYGIGAIAAYIYTRIMVNVSQGTLKHLRDDMFTHMEELPIRYFDTHSHGDIMSTYTNDIDTRAR